MKMSCPKIVELDKTPLKVAPMNRLRYKVVEGSQSCHCCFVATVVDTTKPTMIGGKQYKGKFEEVCECFDKEDADLICKELNKSHD